MIERLFRILTALVAWAGLGIQLWILISGNAFDTPALAVWRFFAFFTILTNLVVAVTATFSAVAPGSAPGRFVAGANARAAVFLYIALVGAVYHLVLADLWAPQGWQLVADQLLHSATPVLAGLGWVLFDRKDGLAFSAIPLFLIYPVAYSLYALIRGGIDGFYPYPFLDVPTLGYFRTIVNTGGLALIFAGGAAALVGIGKLVAGMKAHDPGTPAG
jgi:hypothetical protein